MRERREQAHGPYQRGNRWRVVETSATGARSTVSFETEADALEYIATFNDEAQGRTVSGVVDAYLAASKLKPSSITTLRFRLHALTRCVVRDRLLSAVTPALAADLYRQRVGEVQADTHRGELAAARGMFAWCIKQGWVRANPFGAIEPEGTKVRRHVHLRINEARALRDAAFADATPAGIAVALALLLGLRAGEVVGLRVRDIDDGARVVWIDDAKTAAGHRHLEVPEDLRPRLRRQINGQPADARLFGDVTRHWLNHHVARLCGVAGVPVVSPHALRRTFAALMAEAAPISAVSAALGHASSAITRRHYQPTNAEERRSGVTVLRALKGGRS